MRYIDEYDVFQKTVLRFLITLQKLELTDEYAKAKIYWKYMDDFQEGRWTWQKLGKFEEFDKNET